MRSRLAHAAYGVLATLLGVSCTSETGASTWTIDGPATAVQLGAGDHVTCTYHNRYRRPATGLAIRKVTLGGWIGNYGTGPSANMTQVRADFADASGTVLARLRIGNDTTVAGTDMAFRSRKGKVPAGATQVTIVVTFVGGNNYKLAGADDLSLVLA